MKYGVLMFFMALAIAGTSIAPAYADLYAYRDPKTGGLVLTNRTPPDGAKIVLRRPEGPPRATTLPTPDGPAAPPDAKGPAGHTAGG